MKDVVSTRGPTAPGRPTGPLLPLAPCGKSSPRHFQDVRRYLTQVFAKMRERAHSRGFQLYPVHLGGRLCQEFPVGTRKILVSFRFTFDLETRQQAAQHSQTSSGVSGFFFQNYVLFVPPPRGSLVCERPACFADPWWLKWSTGDPAPHTANTSTDNLPCELSLGVLLQGFSVLTSRPSRPTP